MYSRRKKDTVNLLPPDASSNSSNATLHSESDDNLPTALRKWKRFCTNCPISNCVSYQSLNASYIFVNLVSSINSVPYSLK